MENPLHMTCKICPNGCPMLLEPQGEEGLLLSGNRCNRGLAYAQFQLKDRTSREIRLKYSRRVFRKEEQKAILSFWRMEKAEWIYNDAIAGSPERSEYRSLLRFEGRDFLLEMFPLSKKSQKQRITGRLMHLQSQGLPVTPPLEGKEGFFLYRAKELWQLSPYINGTPLNRHSYWENSAKGRNLGAFLVQLKEADLPLEREETSFDFTGFLVDLWAKMARSEETLFRKIQPVVSYLEKHFLPGFREQPIQFSHGDPHPMNIIWQKNSISTVIDWEFSGPNSRFYDPALTLGCVGSESPEAFTGGFNRALMEELRHSGLYSSRDWDFLFPQILAQRFAWMNEWLRHDDREMQQQELAYMFFLLDFLETR